MNCSYETLAAEYFPDSYKRYWPTARLGVTLNPLSDRSRSSSVRLRAAAISLKPTACLESPQTTGTSAHRAE